VLARYSVEFWKLFFIAALLMLGFAFYQNTVVLYLLNQFHFSPDISYEINGVFTGVVYLCPIIAGWITQRWLRPITSISFGLLLFFIGAFFSFFSNINIYLIGLAFVAISYGLIYVNTFYLLGKLYHLDDPRREASFTLTYIALNIGSLIGFSLGGQALQYNQFHAIIFAIGVFFLLMSGLSIFIFKKYQNILPTKANNWFLASTMFFLLMVIIFIALKFSHFIESPLSIVCMILLLTIFYLGFKAYKNNRVEGRKIILLGILSLITVLYWTFYKLQDSFILVFAQQHVQREFFGFNIPAPTLLSINPIVILLIGPLVSLFWLKTKIKYNSPVSKISLGLFGIGLAFAFLYIGVLFKIPTSLIWVVLFFSIIALSETVLGPGTVSMVGQLSNEKYHFVLLGLTQLSMSSASIFSGEAAAYFNNQLSLGNSVQLKYEHIYFEIAAFILVVSILIFLYRRFIVK
jgi:POT family proton-dependent oligopeptide transporter